MINLSSGSLFYFGNIYSADRYNNCYQYIYGIQSLHMLQYHWRDFCSNCPLATIQEFLKLTILNIWKLPISKLGPNPPKSIKLHLTYWCIFTFKALNNLITYSAALACAMTKSVPGVPEFRGLLSISSFSSSPVSSVERGTHQ